MGGDTTSQLPYDFLADTELNFDPQAFFNDYMFTGESFCAFLVLSLLV